MAKAKKDKAIVLKQWAPIVGKWHFTATAARFLSPLEQARPYGIALAPTRLKRGTVRLAVELADARDGNGRIVFGYHAESGTHQAESGAYFAAGVGGYNAAYVIDEFVPGQGWRAIKAIGSNANLQKNRKYQVEVNLRGQSVQVVVDDVSVAEAVLPHPLLGDQVGLVAWGKARVTFHEPVALPASPQAFVIMKFEEPFNSLYTEVIKPVAASTGFEAFRADDVFRPGIILQDIIRSIIASDVVIAEVTSENANVFYELGYAHAIDKPTVLLAEKPTDPSKHLPFDISGFRVIFYDNTIRGKRNVEIMLRQHLTNIKAGRLDSVP